MVSERYHRTYLIFPYMLTQHVQEQALETLSEESRDRYLSACYLSMSINVRMAKQLIKVGQLEMALEYLI